MIFNQKNKLPKQLLVTIFILLLFIVPVVFFKSEDLQPLVKLIQSNIVTAIPLILIFKILGTIYPPINGQILTIVSIPIVGWQLAYVLDLAGNIIGISLSYYFGKKFGVKIIRKIVGGKIIKKIQNFKIKPNNQIESVIMLRLASFGLSDFIAWSGSIVGIKFIPLIIGSIISHVLINLPIFFMLSQAIQLKSLVFFIPLAILSVVLLWKFRKRYFI